MKRHFLRQNLLLTGIAILTLGLGTKIESHFNATGTEAIATPLTTAQPNSNTPQLLHTLKPFAQDPAPESCTGFSALSNAFSPDNQQVAISVHTFVQRVCGGGSSRLVTWDLKTGNLRQILVDGSAGEALLAVERIRNQEPDPTSIVGDLAHDLAFTKDGKILAAMSDRTIKVWDSKNGKLLQTFTGHRYAVRALEITPDQQTLISGSSDQTIRFWDLKTGRNVTTLQVSQPIQDLRLSPDGKFLISITANASYDLEGTLNLWDVQTRRRIRSFPIALNSPIVLSGDSQILATSMKLNDPEIQLWNTRSGTRKITLKNHRGKVRSLAVSPDGQFLASSSEDQTVKLWNLKTGQIIRTITNVGNINQLSFSPNGRILAMENSETTQFWNWRLPQQISTIPAKEFLGWAPDQQTMVGIMDRNRIGIWRSP